ncbi:MAG: hypothetical protein PVG79_12360 [Gemmatimonadales bacterium]|jgi:formamidopyrimidine-DNA glycosylase
MKLRKPEAKVRLRLRTSEYEAVFFNGPVVELLTPEELQAHESLSALGPDLLHADFDRDGAWRRLQRNTGRPLGDAMLNQRLVAGVGNIFKSEGLFAAGLDPRVPMRLVDRGRLERLWNVLIPMMEASARRSGPVITPNANPRRDGERFWVYRRTRRPCHRCSALIEVIRQGQHRRTTYYCPSCQRGPSLRRL